MDIGSLLNTESPRQGNRPSPPERKVETHPAKRPLSPMQSQHIPIDYDLASSRLYNYGYSTFQVNHAQAGAALYPHSATQLANNVIAPRYSLGSPPTSLPKSDNGSDDGSPTAHAALSETNSHGVVALPDATTKSHACPDPDCTKSFARRSDLARHERIHSGTRPHACDLCEKRFIQRSALTVHKRTHSGEKPHPCNDCPKTFSDSSSLARHRRTHTGKRPYACPFAGCSKTFTRRTTLTRHQISHYGVNNKPEADGVTTTAPMVSIPEETKLEHSSPEPGAKQLASPPLTTTNSRPRTESVTTNDVRSYQPFVGSTPWPEPISPATNLRQHSYTSLPPRTSGHPLQMSPPECQQYSPSSTPYDTTTTTKTMGAMVYSIDSDFGNSAHPGRMYHFGHNGPNNTQYGPVAVHHEHVGHSPTTYTPQSMPAYSTSQWYPAPRREQWAQSPQ